MIFFRENDSGLMDDSIEMDVQIGPNEDIDVDVDPQDAAPTQSLNPVDVAKSAPENVPITVVKSDDENDAGNEEKLEFYVNASDIEKLAIANEFCLVDAIECTISCHEEAGMDRSNTIIIVNEYNYGYAKELENLGYTCAYFAESDEGEQMNMDVQIGPNDEDLSMSADLQGANPVDAIKKNYNSVVVANDGDEFFVDAEDVQKCADLNCESVIDTLNNIIKVNESDCDISPRNLIVLVNENCRLDTYEELKEHGVLTEARFHFLPQFQDEPYMRRYLADLKEAEYILNYNGYPTDVELHRFGDVAIKVLLIIDAISEVMYLPWLILIVTIPVYIVDRLLVWGIDSGREAIVADEGRKVLMAYDRAIRAQKDPKVRQELTDARNKLDESLRQFNVSR